MSRYKNRKFSLSCSIVLIIGFSPANVAPKRRNHVYVVCGYKMESLQCNFMIVDVHTTILLSGHRVCWTLRVTWWCRATINHRQCSTVCESTYIFKIQYFSSCRYVQIITWRTSWLLSYRLVLIVTISYGQNTGLRGTEQLQV